MLSSTEVRRLLDLRRRLRTAVPHLSARRRAALLREIAETRRRLVPGVHDPLPELTPGEVQRELRWTINTLSLAEAELAVQALERLQRLPAGRAARAAP